ncbi:MAG TPA: ABC transporter permease subunit [Streptosporangiales bacterium]
MTTIAAAVRGIRTPRRGRLLVGVLVAWLVLWAAMRGRWTLALDPAQLTGVHTALNGLRDAIDASRNSNPIFLYFFNAIRFVIDQFVTFLQALISQPSFGRPVPAIGWLGVVALVTWVSYAVANIRVAVLAGVGFVFLGLQGLWQESMDTLALTVAAVVLALVFGIPLGVLAGLRSGFNRTITPLLDFMQAMPTFVYLAPLTLFFLIGPASATIATLIYAIPPVIRITAHGIRNVSPAALEATTSLGASRWQKLMKVQLPLARRTIVLGVNQTMMAALAMATIAALIDAPGLGQVVITALQSLDVGTAFNAGLAIVVIAIVLDRVTTAASDRAEAGYRQRSPGIVRLRRILLTATAVVALIGVYLSRTYLWAADFPLQAKLGTTSLSLDVGSPIKKAASGASAWLQDNVYWLTTGLKNGATAGLLNPLQSLLSQSPWFVTCAAVLAITAILAGIRALPLTAVCLALLIASGLWEDAMVTLAQTLVATVIVMVLGVVIGVAMGRGRRLDRGIRPILDGLQTMPSFVYLVPFLGLFGATRFTAIVAAFFYAAPVAIKLIADGIRGVPVPVMEAAASAGSTKWQTITKVQLPMVTHALALAANQGLIFVLAMVVIGGLVGAGALGYDVVAGFSQDSLYGKGLAAGIAIVLLGIMLDRITQRAAARTGRPGLRPGR